MEAVNLYRVLRNQTIHLLAQRINLWFHITSPRATVAYLLLLAKGVGSLTKPQKKKNHVQGTSRTSKTSTKVSAAFRYSSSHLYYPWHLHLLSAIGCTITGMGNWDPSNWEVDRLVPPAMLSTAAARGSNTPSLFLQAVRPY